MRKIGPVLIIFVCICTLTMVYGAINTSLQISGEGVVRAQADIRITNVKLKNAPSGVRENYNNKYSINTATMGVIYDSGSSITYEIEVTNYTDNEYGILSIDGLDNASINGYTIGNKLTKSDGTPIKNGEKTTFDVTFNANGKKSADYLLEFDFERVYKVSYVDIDGSENFKKEVLANTTNFSQNLGSKAPSKVEVTMNGNVINVTYSGGVVTIPSAITGDIVIKAVVEEPQGPEISQGSKGRTALIPVYYDEEQSVWRKADINNSNNSWYDYEKLKWANAVTVVSQYGVIGEDGDSITRDTYLDAPVDTIIPKDAINSMWVWIPRYSYTIKQPYGKGGESAANAGAIDVKFIDTSVTDKGNATYTGDTPENWRTSDAFNFGGVALSGIWYAKFQTTGSLSSECENIYDCEASYVTILPGESIINGNSISTYYKMARALQERLYSVWGMAPNVDDLHISKNSEYMAAVYLAHSNYGKFGHYTGDARLIYRNNNSQGISGMSGGGPKVAASANSYEYDDFSNIGNGQLAGPSASTTGNIYGVYDLNGPFYTYVMANYGTTSYGGSPTIGDSRFSIMPSNIYYDFYTSTDPKTACDKGVCYGHGLSETQNWFNSEESKFVNEKDPWLVRNIYSPFASTNYYAFFYDDGTGNLSLPMSCRLIIAPTN